MRTPEQVEADLRAHLDDLHAEHQIYVRAMTTRPAGTYTYLTAQRAASDITRQIGATTRQLDHVIAGRLGVHWP